ncbi:MAG: alternative ribosome rescue aminoacyl-tRNA hydrolase ArfB [Algiphilus sp.]
MSNHTQECLRAALAAAQWHATRAQGPGGQHVNTSATAVHLHLDLDESGLPEGWCQRLLQLQDGRITPGGRVVIKAQQHRSQAMNREDAFAALRQLLLRGAHPQRARRATQPTRASKRRRLQEKRHRGAVKAGRGSVPRDDG